LKRETSGPLLVAHPSAKKLLDSFGDDVSLFFQGKVPRIEQMKLSCWQITLIGLCSLYGEERIILSPQDQGARLAGPEVLVPSVVEREVGIIIVQQVELDRVIPRTIEVDLVKSPIVRANLFLVLRAVCVLKGGCPLGALVESAGLRRRWPLRSGFSSADRRVETVCPFRCQAVEASRRRTGRAPRPTAWRAPPPISLPSGFSAGRNGWRVDGRARYKDRPVA
jgi:hypothetical protein